MIYETKEKDQKNGHGKHGNMQMLAEKEIQHYHALQQYLNRYMDFLNPIIQRGIDSGEFRAVDPREVAIAMGAIIEGTVLLWVYDRNTIDPERHIQSGINLLLEGIQICKTNGL